MKLLKTDFPSQPNPLRELELTKVTVETNLLELLVLIAHYGNVSPYESAGNTVAILKDWKANKNLTKEIEDLTNSIDLVGLVDYTSVSDIVQQLLREAGML